MTDLAILNKEVTAPCGLWSGVVRHAVDGCCKRRASLAHLVVAEAAEAIHEHGDRDAFDRVEVDSATTGDRIVIRLEQHFARKPANRGRAGRNQ